MRAMSRGAHDGRCEIQNDRLSQPASRSRFRPARLPRAGRGEFATELNIHAEETSAAPDGRPGAGSTVLASADRSLAIHSMVP